MFAAPKESSPGRKGKAGGGDSGGGARGDIDLLRDDLMPTPTDLGTVPAELAPTDLSVSLCRSLSLSASDSFREPVVCACVRVCVCVCVL